MIKSVTLSLLFFIMSLFCVKGEQLYVNPITGKDINSGIKTQPLKSLSEAARRVNLNKGQGETTIILSEGIHLLTKTVMFTNDKYTLTNRLTIRAEVMPDDTGWTPKKMPVIITVVPTEPGVGEKKPGVFNPR